MLANPVGGGGEACARGGDRLEGDELEGDDDDEEDDLFPRACFLEGEDSSGGEPFRSSRARSLPLSVERRLLADVEICFFFSARASSSSFWRWTREAAISTCSL